jgi:hypothetical protein
MLSLKHLVAAVGLSQSAPSLRLAMLRAAGVVAAASSSRTADGDDGSFLGCGALSRCSQAAASLRRATQDDVGSQCRKGDVLGCTD